MMPSISGSGASKPWMNSASVCRPTSAPTGHQLVHVALYSGAFTAERHVEPFALNDASDVAVAAAGRLQFHLQADNRLSDLGDELAEQVVLLLHGHGWRLATV
jgi:hypothetical protein